MKKITQLAAGIALASGAMTVSSVAMAEVTANASVTSNYVWRGLTQTTNDAAVQGGVDYANESGLYVGTWVSNVKYSPIDDFSYEHDIYFGFAGEAGAIGYDVGYLYYNYDSVDDWDFGEIYGSISIADFSATLFILANTQGDEPTGRDWGFGEAMYLSLDYAVPLGNNGTELGFHAGYHDGDFAEDFNGVNDSYADFNVSVSNGGFSFMASYADVDDDSTNLDIYQNDEIRFVASYSIDFEL